MTEENKKPILYKKGATGKKYSSLDGVYTVEREALHDTAWVLRKDGFYVDHDAYRHNLAERNKVELKSSFRGIF